MNTAHKNYDVAVIGGGPAGASAAAFMARSGLEVCVLEQKSFPRQKVCGEFISPAGWSVLADLNVASRLHAMAGPALKYVAVYPEWGLELRGALPVHDDGHCARAIGRDVLDFILLQRAAELGATIFQPVHVSQVRGGARTGFEVFYGGSPRPLHARMVVLAHGSPRLGAMNSPSPGQHRNANRPDAPPSDIAGWLCFKIHLENVHLSDDTIAIGGVEGLYAGLVRTGSSGSAPNARPVTCMPRYNLAFVVERRLLRQYGSAAELYGYLQEHNNGFGRCLRHARPIGDFLACGPMVPGVRQVYTDGRFFVGNAAGEVHALIGEGLTLALGAGQLLGRVIGEHRAALAGGEDLAVIGEAYRDRWLDQFGSRLRWGNVFSQVLMRTLLSALATAYLHAFPDIFSMCIRWSGKQAGISRPKPQTGAANVR